MPAWIASQSPGKTSSGWLHFAATGFGVGFGVAFAVAAALGFGTDGCGVAAAAALSAAGRDGCWLAVATATARSPTRVTERTAATRRGSSVIAQPPWRRRRIRRARLSDD